MSRVEIRIATDDDFPAMAELDGLVFGSPWDDAHLDAALATMDLDRFRVACDDGQIVGVSGSYALELTVPGHALVPAGGITWVAVAPTHRRQGVLTAMMDDLHRDIDARDEPISMLTASEGGIYERFGYGVASQVRVVRIDPRRTQMRPENRPSPGTVRMTTLDDPRLADVFDRYRRGRVGEIDRDAAGDALFMVQNPTGVAVAVHADGFAVWKTTAQWNMGHPAFEMQLLDMIAITPEAHCALWHTLLSVDLVGSITSARAMAPDDALPYLVTDPRSIRTTDLNDSMWLHLRDIRCALEARTYSTDDEFVLDVDLGPDGVERWQLAGGPDGATVRRARRRADLELDRAALGAIYLGGVRPGTLVRAGNVRARSEDVVRRADAFFLADRAPHLSTGF